MPTSGAQSFSKSSTSISSGRRKPLLFLSNLLWRRKKVLEIGEIDDIIFDRNHRTRSEPSGRYHRGDNKPVDLLFTSILVISYSCTAMTSHHNNPHQHHNNSHHQQKNASTLTMTPGRCRDLDQDMYALRLSRQDNPFVQKVLASRESLIDTLDDHSDDAILMATEEVHPDCEDPFTMPEVKEHMIRSPPPTTWPRSPQYMFTYNQDNNLTISSQSSDVRISNWFKWEMSITVSLPPGGRRIQQQALDTGTRSLSEDDFGASSELQSLWWQQRRPKYRAIQT